MNYTLLLQLVGPMQSWGHRSRFDNRDTSLEPTRSGVIGLLCAALGWDRNTDLTPFENLRMGVRVDRPGRVAMDYHTAQNHFREGEDAATVVSSRFYLADARFLVGLQSDDLEWLQRLAQAICDPHWPLFLGRKAFPPSLPVNLPGSTIREGKVRAVLEAEPWRALDRRELGFAQWERDHNPSAALKLVLETNNPREGEAIGDVPTHFARRNFSVRYLQFVPVKPTQIMLHEVVQ